MATVKCIAAFLCKIVLIGSMIITLSSGRADAEKGKAYIWIGDINPPWYSLAIRSANPFGPVDPYQELKPVIDAQRRKMEAMGYEVVVVDAASAHEIEKAIRDPQTKAFAFFGHGDPKVAGTLSTLAGEDITAGDIKKWAQEELEKKIGTPDTWRNLSVEERKKLYNAWTDAHFDMQYVYMHTCYGMQDNSMVDAVIADGGEFRGYKGKAYRDDRSESAKNEAGRMEDRLKELQKEHEALGKKLEASGGRSEQTAKDMQDIYKEFQKTKAALDKKNASAKAVADKEPGSKGHDQELQRGANTDKETAPKEGKDDPASGSKAQAKDKRPQKKDRKTDKQPGDKEIELRNKVLSALKAHGFPSPDALVNRLMGILDREGEGALSAALRDMTNMQGAFKGSNMTLTIKDFSVSGTFFEQSEYTLPNAKVIVTITDGRVKGWVDPDSGVITMDLDLVSQIDGRTQQLKQKLVGSYDGRGYQGHIAGDENSKWKVEK